MSNKTFTLTNNQTGESVDLPVYQGTSGAPVIDVQKLYALTGHFTYDPGFKATASCDSKITFIDGEKGELLYRGYPVEQLAEHCNFLEVAYLLLHGQLPDAEQKSAFEQRVTLHTMIDEKLKSFYNGFHYDAHPMAIMNGVIGSLAAFYQHDMNIHNHERRLVTARRLVAKVPTIAAYAYKHSMGEPFMYPQNHLSYAGNFLHMMYARPTEEYEIDPIAEKALDMLFILHADHEQNASTSTVRLAGSSQTNPYSAISAGCASLWGPAHGGANEAVLRMLDEIGDVSKIEKFVARAKDKNDPFRLMGFGHRVYKNYDPRAKIIKGVADEILQKYGNDPRLELAKRLEEVALSDEYFVKRKLFPNVDFYSGIIYRALGIPLNMFTVMFAIGRSIGWIAHWHEMMGAESLNIGRPRQLYTGEAKRDVIPIEKRHAA